MGGTGGATPDARLAGHENSRQVEFTRSVGWGKRQVTPNRRCGHLSLLGVVCRRRSPGSGPNFSSTKEHLPGGWVSRPEVPWDLEGITALSTWNPDCRCRDGRLAWGSAAGGQPAAHHTARWSCRSRGQGAPTVRRAGRGAVRPGRPCRSAGEHRAGPTVGRGQGICRRPLTARKGISGGWYAIRPS